MTSKLYLIPNLLSDGAIATIPRYINEVVSKLRCFVVEEERSARRFLKALDPQFPFDNCTFFVFNEHTPFKEAQKFCEASCHQDIAIISEAGCPCVADPGADIVFWAHQKNIQVIPLIGPSSIMLALMASGLNGQNFAFNGYLPKDKGDRIHKIKLLEKRSLTEGQTQIFMETPYRNQSLFEDILSCCDLKTLLCIAVDLTGLNEYIKTFSIKEWQRMKFIVFKKPALFLLQKSQ